MAASKIVSAQNVQLNNNQRENVAGMTTEYPYSMHVTDLGMGPIPWHWHEELEFGYVVNGEIEIILADRSYTIEKNQGFLQTAMP